MGEALLAGLTAHGREVTVIERDPARQEYLKMHPAGYQISEKPVPCEGAIIAVKPKDVELAISDAVTGGAQRILSIATGITLAKLHQAAGGRVPVVRAMPNIGALVERSATAICGGSTAHEEDLVWAESVLSSSGRVVRIAEDQMDAVTGLSGSGPAYLFLIAEAMIDGGVAAGLSHNAATELTIETFVGAGALLASKTRAPAQLRADVTTPAGTTAAALRRLEDRGVRAAIVDAVLAATARSHELGLPQQH